MIDPDDIRPAIGLKSEPLLEAPPDLIPEISSGAPRLRRSSQYYDLHKEEILMDWLEIGSGEMQKKWVINPSTWFYLKKRWFSNGQSHGSHEDTRPASASAPDSGD